MCLSQKVLILFIIKTYFLMNFQLLQASYSFYIWPSAPVLAWFLWTQRNNIRGKRILEIGSGTALPGN